MYTLARIIGIANTNSNNSNKSKYINQQKQNISIITAKLFNIPKYFYKKKFLPDLNFIAKLTKPWGLFAFKQNFVEFKQ